MCSHFLFCVYSFFPQTSSVSSCPAVKQKQNSISSRSLNPVSPCDGPQQGARWKGFQIIQYRRFSKKKKKKSVNLVNQIAWLPQESNYRSNEAGVCILCAKVPTAHPKHGRACTAQIGNPGHHVGRINTNYYIKGLHGWLSTAGPCSHLPVRDIPWYLEIF